MKDMDKYSLYFKLKKECLACVEDSDKYYQVDGEILQKPKSKLEHTCKQLKEL